MRTGIRILEGGATREEGRVKGPSQLPTSVITCVITREGLKEAELAAILSLSGVSSSEGGAADKDGV